MPIVDGTPVNAANTNNEKLDRQADDTAFGIMTFASTDPSQGGTVTGMQRAVNRLFTAVGCDNVSDDGVTYLGATPNTIISGDDHEESLVVLSNKFAGLTGHTHDGTDGEGPVVFIPEPTAGTRGGVSLPAGNIQPVSGANAVGTTTPDFRYAPEDHIHQGVHSYAVSGDTALFGDVTISAAGSIALVRTGQNIEISGGGAMAGTAGVTSLAVSGGASVSGDITLTGSGNVIVTRTGQNFDISGIYIDPAVTVVSAAGAGTYNTPANAKRLVVEMVGAGGGGAGSGTTPGAATAGTATTFGVAFLTCNGGGLGSTSAGVQGTGGTATGGTYNQSGSNGAGGGNSGTGSIGGMGGGNPFGPGPGGGNTLAGPGHAAATPGAGGGGAGSATTVNSGGGGGSGGYLRAFVPTPAASYAYSVGTGGNAGTAGTGGAAGGAGATGLIIVTAYFS